jgi:hypothetical protein
MCRLPDMRTEVADMRWVTRERPMTDRIACQWLIRRFIDPAAETDHIPADQVLAVAEARAARSFDAPGADFTHRDGKRTFEVLIAEVDLVDDPPLVRLARIGTPPTSTGSSTPTPSGLGCSPSASAAWTSRPTTSDCCDGACSCTTPVRLVPTPDRQRLSGDARRPGRAGTRSAAGRYGAGLAAAAPTGCSWAADVPTRQAYVVGVVEPSERTAAAAYTNTARYLARPLAPLVAGALLRDGNRARGALERFRAEVERAGGDAR